MEKQVMVKLLRDAADKLERSEPTDVISVQQLVYNAPIHNPELGGMVVDHRYLGLSMIIHIGKDGMPNNAMLAARLFQDHVRRNGTESIELHIGKPVAATRSEITNVQQTHEAPDV